MMTDLASFLADFFGHDHGKPDIEAPSHVAEVIVAKVAVMRSFGNRARPVGRCKVFFPSVQGIQFALDMIDEKGEARYHGIPIGVFENGDGSKCPVAIDEEFLLGPLGAHFNVSGISGLAAKTSAVQFFLRSTQQYTSRNVAFVVFNVKSRDLLYLDKPNPRLKQDDWSMRVYEELGIPPQPFDDVRIFAPSAPYGTMSLRQDGKVESFAWNLKGIEQALPSLFAPEDWDDKMESLWIKLREVIDQKNLEDFGGFIKYLRREGAQLLERNRQYWQTIHHVATFWKMINRLETIQHVYRGLLAGPGMPPKEIPLKELSPGKLLVVDIQMLGDRGQRFVFNRLIDNIAELLEQRELKDTKCPERIVVFVDELNKFARSGAWRSPLKEALIEVAARGRSIGLILFGAQQFASGVDKQVIDNTITTCFGRTESGELRDERYRMLTHEERARLLNLPQGHLLVKTAKFSHPIFVRFPHPPCIPGDEYSRPEEEVEKTPQGDF